MSKFIPANAGWTAIFKPITFYTEKAQGTGDFYLATRAQILGWKEHKNGDIEPLVIDENGIIAYACDFTNYHGIEYVNPTTNRVETGASTLKSQKPLNGEWDD